MRKNELRDFLNNSYGTIARMHNEGRTDDYIINHIIAGHRNISDADFEIIIQQVKAHNSMDGDLPLF